MQAVATDVVYPLIIVLLLLLCFFVLRDRSRLEKEVTKLNDALDHVPSYIYIKGPDQRYLYGNKATLEVFGVSGEALVGATDHQFFPPDTVLQLEKVDAEVLKSGRVMETEITAYFNSQKPTVFWEVKHPLRDATGNIVGLVGISTDMTELYELRNELERRASTDGLTSLKNRESFFDAAKIEFDRSVRSGAGLVLMVLDLDHFKLVNDRHGHPAGDAALRSFATVCQESIRSCDIIGRIGGEEFAILLPDTDVKDALEVAERIRTADLSFSVGKINDPPISLKVSIGIASVLESDTSISGAYSRADAALYKAKQNGRNTTSTWAPALVDSKTRKNTQSMDSKTPK